MVRARDLGIHFDGVTGANNAITDVPGVEVGFVTLVGEHPTPARTGVTAILPRGKAKAHLPCAAGIAVLNGNGELTGRSWIEESGQLQAPIGITNSHAVGAVHTGIDRWMAEHHPTAAAAWMLPVVGETWDGYLNSINAEHVHPEHAVSALNVASGGAVAEGNVGGGTGMNCYGFKGGTGTASRIVTRGDHAWHVGALVQANFGRRKELRVLGVPLGRESQVANPMETTDWFADDLRRAGSDSEKAAEHGHPKAVPGAGSVIVVIATDAPLLADQCRALARRVPLGLARTGTTGSHFSGDIFLAFSTANEGALASRMSRANDPVEQMQYLAWGEIDPFYAAVVEAVEEAVVNALVAAEDMSGRDGHESFAISHDEIRAAFR